MRWFPNQVRSPWFFRILLAVLVGTLAAVTLGLQWWQALVIVILIGAVASLLEVASAYRDRDQKDNADAKYATILQQLAQAQVDRDSNALQLVELSKQLTVVTSSLSTPSGPDNQTLAAEAVTLARQMRDVENRYKNRLTLEIFTPRNWEGLTDIEKSREWAAYTGRMAQYHNDEVAEFRSELLPRAQYLKQELEDRLPSGKLPKNSDASELIAFKGFLAGVSPVSDAADYLELLALRLLN